MSAFDAIGFFQRYNIDYRTEGTKWNRAGWVQIECPFCTGNPGWHLGYSFESGFWTCWRCGFHRQFDVLVALLGSRRLAREALREFRGGEYYAPGKRKRTRELELPYGLQPLTGRARRYLEKRKFDPDLIADVWKIQSTGITGPVKHRIFIPIFLNGVMVSWQCRDITGKSGLRYIGQAQDREILSNKETLYGMDLARGRSCLVVEGVTDVWRMGPGAVATFGIKYKPAQVSMLVRQFDTFHIMFDPPDPQAQEMADKLGNELAAFGRQVKIWTPDTDLDPGDMDQEDASAFMRDLFGKNSGY